MDRLLRFPDSVKDLRRAAGGLLPSFLKPCRDASRRYRALWHMRDDRSGGHDKAVVEFGTRKILGLRFALKRLGRPRAPASNCSASPRDFEGHIPSMLLHPIIPMDLPPSITSEGSVVRFAWGRTRDVACVRFWAGVMFILEPLADVASAILAAAMTYFRLITVACIRALQVRPISPVPPTAAGPATRSAAASGRGSRGCPCRAVATAPARPSRASGRDSRRYRDATSEAP